VLEGAEAKGEAKKAKNRKAERKWSDCRSQADEALTESLGGDKLNWMSVLNIAEAKWMKH
jgi:hypothetical protein